MGGMFAGSPLTIAKDSKNKDLALEWIKFTSTDFAQEYIYEALGSVPVIKSAAEWVENR